MARGGIEPPTRRFSVVTVANRSGPEETLQADFAAIAHRPELA